jgi:hypothetical protein
MLLHLRLGFEDVTSGRTLLAAACRAPRIPLWQERGTSRGSPIHRDGVEQEAKNEHQVRERTGDQVWMGPHPVSGVRVSYAISGERSTAEEL